MSFYSLSHFFSNSLAYLRFIFTVGSISTSTCCSICKVNISIATIDRPNSNTAITLTKVAHSQTTFAQGIYKTNDFTHTADLDKGTMIFVGVGTESSSPAAKNARGIMNITAIQR